MRTRYLILLGTIITALATVLAAFIVKPSAENHSLPSKSIIADRDTSIVAQQPTAIKKPATGKEKIPVKKSSNTDSVHATFIQNNTGNNQKIIQSGNVETINMN